MTEPGADQRTRMPIGVERYMAFMRRMYEEMTDDERADVLFLRHSIPLCTRAELLAAIEDYRQAAADWARHTAGLPVGVGDYDSLEYDARARLRALLGMEAE
jgi:hypothetical protein